MTAIFRRATHADIPAMSHIRLSVTENILRDPTRVTPELYEDYLERCGRGWVAEVDGAVAAFSYADKLDGSIWALFVDPAHEGRGLAKPLLTLAETWLFASGFSCIRLTTTPDTRADRFYERQGWRRGAVTGHEVEFCLLREDRPDLRADHRREIDARR